MKYLKSSGIYCYFFCCNIPCYCKIVKKAILPPHHYPLSQIAYREYIWCKNLKIVNYWNNTLNPFFLQFLKIGNSFPKKMFKVFLITLIFLVNSPPCLLSPRLFNEQAKCIWNGKVCINKLKHFCAKIFLRNGGWKERAHGYVWKFVSSAVSTILFHCLLILLFCILSCRMNLLILRSSLVVTVELRDS